MLVQLALRLLTVEALRGRTWARDRVADSRIMPIDEVAKKDTPPFIAVYTDETASGGDGKSSRDVTSGVVTTLVLELGVTATTRLRLDNGEEAEGEDLVLADGAVEYVLDILERQVHMVLTEAPEGELWRSFAHTINSRASQRGASMSNGVRFSGKQVVMKVLSPMEPSLGREPAGAWAQLIERLAVSPDPKVREMGQGMRAAFQADADMPEWVRQKLAWDHTQDEARALLFTPPLPAEETSPKLQMPPTLPAADPKVHDFEGLDGVV
ncbi:MAG: hypothetical protein AB1592_15815 [Pseudomonadota bacterium]